MDLREGNGCFNFRMDWMFVLLTVIGLVVTVVVSIGGPAGLYMLSCAWLSPAGSSDEHSLSMEM